MQVPTTPTQLRFFVKSTHFGLLQAFGASAAPMHGPQASPHPRGGLTWAIDPSLCAALMDRFDAETFDYFGVRLFSFVSCEEITDALIRGFSTWSANHGRLHFYSTTRECAGPSNNPAAECSFAEVVITGGATPHGVPLEAWTNTSTLDAASGDVIGDLGSGDGATTRVTLSFDTSTTCYYMDSTVCDTLRNLRFRTPLLSWFDPLITARALLYLPALFGLVYLTHNLVLVTYRSRKAGWAHWLYVLTSLSHRWRLLTLLLAIPPLVDWKMLLPCQKCVAFETLATHAAGRALGLMPTGTGDASSTAIAPSLPGSCSAAWQSTIGDGATSSADEDANAGYALDPPGPMQGANCLGMSDARSLASLYPDCLVASTATDGSVVCSDSRRHIWAFRLTITVLPSITIFVILLVPTVLLIRFMSRRRVRSLATLLTKAIMAEEEVATEAAKANAPKAGRSMRRRRIS